MTKIAFFDAKPYDKEAFNACNSTNEFQITYFDTRLTPETLPLAQGFEVLCLFVHDTITSAMADTLKDMGIKLLALRSSGFNHIDMASLKDKIQVVHVPKYSPFAVAEYTIALLLSLNRKLHLAYSRTRTNDFSLVGLQGFDMHGKTAGVIGAGQIGAIVARLLSAFGMKVFLYDTYKNEKLEKEGCIYTDLETLYRESDVITLHCPLFQNNWHMIDEKAFSLMKTGVVLINTSRGGLVDSKALIAALKEKKVSGAGLDVYEEEDRFFFEDLSGSFIDDDVLARLLSFPNVFITSHQAFFTKEAMHDIASTTFANIRAFVNKAPLQNVVPYPS